MLTVPSLPLCDDAIERICENSHFKEVRSIKDFEIHDKNQNCLFNCL